MMPSVRALVLLAADVAAGHKAPRKQPAAPAAAGDPLASLHRVAGPVRIDCSGALETVMLLAELGSTGPAITEFQAQARARFAVYAQHPAVVETSSLLTRGFGYKELAEFSTLLSPAPYFALNESDELAALAKLLPSADLNFNVDRLLGYARLIREFYSDAHMGKFLRESTGEYQQALKQVSAEDLPPGVKVLLSPLAPVPPAGRIEFSRRGGRPANYIVLGG